MSQETGAFPSFRVGAFGIEEDIQEETTAEASLSFSSSDDSRNKRNANEMKMPETSSRVASTSQPSAKMSSYKDKLYSQSFSSGEESEKGKNEKAQASTDNANTEDKAKSVPVDEDGSTIQSELQSNVTDTFSAARRSVHSVSTTSRRPTRQQRFAVHTMPCTRDPTSVLENLFISIEQERQMHKLASQNLRAVNNWILFFPAIALTLAAGVLALVAESGLDLSDDTRVYFSITVGVVALVAVFWQALAKQLDMGSRSALHEATSIALKRLAEDILLTMSSTEDVPTDYVTTISEKFGQALDGCTSTVPLRIDSAFSTVQDRMVLILRPPTGQPRKQFFKKDFMRFHATAYDELTSEIIHHWLWPFHLPKPRVAADNAMRNFKEIITEGKEASRWRSDNRLCPCLGKATTERSLFDVLPAASFADEEEFVRGNGTDV